MSKTPSAAVGPARIANILIVIASLVLVVGGAMVFFMNSQISDMSTTLAGKESEVGGKEQIAAKYQATLALYNQTAARTQFLEASVSPKAFVPTLLSQLQTLAGQTRLEVVDIHPGQIDTGPTAPGPDGKKPAPQPYDTMDIGLDVTGSYRATMAFLYDLTTFPKIVSVSSVQFHPNGQTTDPTGQSVPLISTSMHFTAFVFPDSSNPPPVAAPPAVNSLTRPFSTDTTAIGAAAAKAASRAVGVTEAGHTPSEIGTGSL